MRSRLIRGLGIGVGALFIATLGIFASDSLQGIDSRISNLGSVSGSVCPRGMSLFKGADGDICVDQYEASPGETCPVPEPRNVLESEKNAGTSECYAASQADAPPWRFVTLAQAQRLCAMSGKRLPTSEEWYKLALGTNESECLVSGDAPRKTGESGCISVGGAYDMIGNVWEWVDETVEGNVLNGRTLPPTGYVTEADAAGVAIGTREGSSDPLYGDDYFWSKTEGTFGMIRGGFYGSGLDAGLYTVNASVPTNFATQGVGFRCVQSL